MALILAVSVAAGQAPCAVGARPAKVAEQTDLAHLDPELEESGAATRA